MTPPWSSLVQVKVMRPGEGTVFGTGLAIGPRSVLTVAHNLIDPQFYQLPDIKNIRVLAFPAMGDTIGTPISVHLSANWTGPAWPPTEDYCILKMGQDLDLPPLIPTSLPVEDLLQNFNVTIGGYAAGAPVFSLNTGTALLEQAGTLRYQVATINGHSGAPIMIKHLEEWRMIGLHQARIDEGQGLAFASSTIASLTELPLVLA